MLFYFILFFYIICVSCKGGSHVGEGILVFKGYLRVFLLLFVFGGYFSHGSSREEFIYQFLFHCNCSDRETLFIEPTTSQKEEAIKLKVDSRFEVFFFLLLVVEEPQNPGIGLGLHLV